MFEREFCDRMPSGRILCGMKWSRGVVGHPRSTTARRQERIHSEVGTAENFAGPELETPREWQDMIQQVAGHAPVRWSDALQWTLVAIGHLFLRGYTYALSHWLLL